MTTGSKKRKLRMPSELAEQIRHLHPHLKVRIKEGLKTILEDETAGKALKDELTGLRSFRVKRIRIIYRTKSKQIEIIAIGPRKLIYEETFRIIRRDKKR